MKRFYSILCLVLCVSFFSGCDDDIGMAPPPVSTPAPPETPTAPTPSAGSSALSEAELDRQIAASLKDIEERAAAHTQKTQPLQIVRDFIAQKKYDEAADGAAKISDTAQRDLLLTDIVRAQLADIIAQYNTEEKKLQPILLPESIQRQLQEVMETAELISDPVRKNGAFQSIALFHIQMKDKSGAAKTLRAATESLQQADAPDVRKAKGVLDTAQWLMRIDQKDDALPLFQAADTLLTEKSEPFAAAMLLQEVAAHYMQLNQIDKARETCDKAQRYIEAIPFENLQVAAMLSFAETLITVRTHDTKLSLDEQIAGIKQYVLKTSKAVKSLPFIVDPASKAANSLDLPVPLRTDMLYKKDGLLRKVAEMQVWGTTLDDVQQTLREIDDFKERDAVLVETVKMLTATNKSDLAVTWAEKITDPKLKKQTLDKIAAAP